MEGLGLQPLDSDPELSASAPPEAGDLGRDAQATAQATAPAQFPVRVKLSDGSWKRVIFAKPPSDDDIDEAVSNFNAKLKIPKPAIGARAPRPGDANLDLLQHDAAAQSAQNQAANAKFTAGQAAPVTMPTPEQWQAAGRVDQASSPGDLISPNLHKDMATVRQMPGGHKMLKTMFRDKFPTTQQLLDMQGERQTQAQMKIGDALPGWLDNPIFGSRLMDAWAISHGGQPNPHPVSSQLAGLGTYPTDVLTDAAVAMNLGGDATAKQRALATINVALKTLPPDAAIGVIGKALRGARGITALDIAAKSGISEKYVQDLLDQGGEGSLVNGFKTEASASQAWHIAPRGTAPDLASLAQGDRFTVKTPTEAPVPGDPLRPDLVDASGNPTVRPVVEPPAETPAPQLLDRHGNPVNAPAAVAPVATPELTTPPAPPPVLSRATGGTPVPHIGETPMPLSEFDELPGVRNLPDAMKEQAMRDAQAAGLSGSGEVSVGSYQKQLQAMGVDSAKAARIAAKGKLSPQQVNYLGNLLPHVADARDAALAQVQRLRESGARPEIVEAAQKTADTLADQHTEILKAFTGGSSDIGRGLRMLQELSRGVLDLSGVVREIEKKTGSAVGRKAVQSIEQKLNRLRTAQADAAAESLPKTATNGSGYGAGNTVVTQDAYQAAKDAWKEKTLGRGPMLGIPLDALPHLVTMGAYHIEAGARTFAVWAARMKGDVGEHFTDSQMKDLYGRSLEEARKKMMAGSQYSPDLLTKGPAGIQSPEVLAAREELLAEIRKQLKPSAIDTAGEVLRAKSLATVSVLSHILGAGPTTLAAKELGRLPRTAINYVNLVLGRPIARQGFSAGDFMKSWIKGVPRGLQEAGHYMGRGENSLQAGAGGSPEFFGGRGGLNQVVADVKGAAAPGSLGERMNSLHSALQGTLHSVGTLHGAAQQPSSFFPAYYRALYDQATVFATNARESALKSLDPSLSSLEGTQLKLAAKKWLVEHPQDEMVHAAIDEATGNSLMQDNRVTDLMRTVRNGMKQGGSPGKIAAAIWTMFEPVTRPGTNAAFLTAEFSPIGAVRSGLNQRALSKGLEVITPADRAMVARLFDHGATGTALIGLGAILHRYGGITATSEHGEGYRENSEKNAPGFVGRVQAGDTAGALGATVGLKVRGTPETVPVSDASSVPSRFFGIGGMLLQLGADLDRDQQTGTSTKSALGKMGRDTERHMDPLRPTLESAKRAVETVDRLGQSAKKKP